MLDLKNNTKISIAKKMIDNERFFGAMTFLSTCRHSNYQEYFQLLVLWECCLTFFLSKNSTSEKMAGTTSEAQLAKLNAEGEHGYSNCSGAEKLAIWEDTLKRYPAITIRNFDESFSEVLSALIEPTVLQIDQIAELASRTDLQADSVHNKIQAMIESLSVPKIREVYALHQQSYSLNFRLLLIQALIKKVGTGYWEHYNAAQILAQLGRHVIALEHYTLFFDKALEENNANEIRCAMSAALQSLLYVKTIEEGSAYFFSKCPTDIAIHPEVAKIKLEVDSVIASRKIFNDCRNSADCEVGYLHLDKSQLEGMHAKAVLLVSVHPNYQLFYQLFKICAALDRTAEASAWLAQAYEANVLIFKIG